MKLINKLLFTFKCAIKGIYWGLKSEWTLKFDILFLIIVYLGFSFLHISYAEWMFVILISAFVICTEFINTCIEKILDLTNPNFEIKVQKIKDMAAAASLFAAIFSFAIGVMILIKHWPHGT